MFESWAGPRNCKSVRNIYCWLLHAEPWCWCGSVLMRQRTPQLRSGQGLELHTWSSCTSELDACTGCSSARGMSRQPCSPGIVARRQQMLH